MEEPNPQTPGETSNPKSPRIPSPESRHDPSQLSHDISVCKQLLKTDPTAGIAMMDRILYSDLSFKVPTFRISTNQMLSDLREIVFYKHEQFMEDLPNDFELVDSIKIWMAKLSSRISDMTTEQLIGFRRFIGFFHDSVLNIDAREENHLSLKISMFRHNDLLLKLQAAEDKSLKINESIAAEQDKVKNINLEIQELNDWYLKQLQEKKKIDKEIENISAERTQVWNEVLEFKRMEEKFVADYDEFRKIYAEMKSNPPF